MKTKKRKVIETFCKKKCYCLETSVRACKKRNAELEAESVPLQEIIKFSEKKS